MNFKKAISNKLSIRKLSTALIPIKDQTNHLYNNSRHHILLKEESSFAVNFLTLGKILKYSFIALYITLKLIYEYKVTYFLVIFEI